jgi:hypothetical protein
VVCGSAIDDTLALTKGYRRGAGFWFVPWGGGGGLGGTRFLFSRFIISYHVLAFICAISLII